jgi:raffinose/stachyose/melibiose transport system substrate-binding protein
MAIAEQEKASMKRTIVVALMASSMLGQFASVAMAEDVTLIIESWRNDDLQAWQNEIVPAFEKKYPGIKLKFAPTAPTEYNAALNAKLSAGTAGDLITCRPFDASLELYNQKHLAALDDLDGMGNFADVAKAAWRTDDAKTTFCVPMASVIHGFIYNKQAFDQLKLSPPTTEDEFFTDLEKIKKDGSYVPLAMGTKDQWEAAQMGYQNIGPVYWKGEAGRRALIAGKQKMTDPEWIKPFEVLAKWGPYLGDGFQAQAYPDSQNLFTLGRAAIYPAGSWEISMFVQQAGFGMGAFPPPVKSQGDTCQIENLPDHALGLNANAKHPAEARKFLEWVASKEFAEVYGNAIPGFFPLTSEHVELKNPLANQFLSWRDKCESSIPPSYQFLSRGTPNFDTELWRASANVINGTETPQQAAKRLQDGLDSWYKPAQSK